MPYCNANTDGNGYVHAHTYANSCVYTYTNSHGDIHAYSYGHSDLHADTNTNSYVHAYTYSYSDAKLHRGLHIHRGDRNDRAGHNRHWQPLR